MSKRIPVNFTVSGTAAGAMRNDLSIAMRKPLHETFELATDEGRFHGGEGTAPPPLAYFMASWAGCIMTQIRAFARKMHLELRALTVEGSADWIADVHGSGYESQPERFAMMVHIESDDDPSQLRQLVAAARRGCFVEQSLRTDLDVNFQLRINDTSLMRVS